MRRRLLTSALSFLLCLGAPALADDLPREARLITRQQALSLGATRGPGVALAAAPRAAVATLGKRASALVRPPVLTLGGGYRAGALTPGAELSVSLAQEVPLAGVGSARSGLAKSFARSVDT